MKKYPDNDSFSFGNSWPINRRPVHVTKDNLIQDDPEFFGNFVFMSEGNISGGNIKVARCFINDK